MQVIGEKGGGVKISRKTSDVINGWPLSSIEKYHPNAT